MTSLRGDARNRPVWLRYGAALFLVALASLLSALPHPWLTPAPLAVFFAAVALSAWYGGTGPALAAIALSLLPITLFALQPVGALAVSSHELTALLIFVVVSALLVLLSASRDRAARSAQEHEARFRLAQEAGGIGVWDWDAATDRTYWSETMWPLYGLEPGSGTPDNALWLSRLHPEDRTWIETAMAALLASARTEYRDEFRVIHPDGAERWLEVVARVARDDAGRPVRMSGVNLDVTERKRAEAQLRQSTERLRRMVNTPGVGVLVFDDTGTLRDANETFLAMTGYDPEVITAGALTSRDMTPAEYVAISEEQMAKLAETGRIGPYEKEYLRADGTRSWMMFAGASLGDGTIVEYCLDINDRKQVEERLRVSEARARFLAEASTILAASLDFDEAVQRVVRLAVPLLADWCVIDLLGGDRALHRLAIVHRDPDCGEVADELRTRYPTIPREADHTAWKVLRSGQPWFDPEVDPNRFVAEARDERHLALLRRLGFASELVVPLVARGRSLGVLTLVQGDSGRRFEADDVPFAEELARHCALAIDNARLYREARAAEAKVRRLFDTGVIGLLVADGERILEANDRFLQMVGYSRQDLDAGRLHWREMTPPEHAAVDARALEELATRGLCTPFEKEYLRKDGSRVPILLGAVTLERMAPPWIGAVVDLTAQKAAEWDRVAFVDAATHDLKNPLTSLRGRAQLLLRQARRSQTLRSEAIEPGLRAIDADAGRMVTLIDEVLDAAHLRSGLTLALHRDHVDLVSLAEACVQEAQRRTDRHTVRVEAAVPALVGRWDRARLERAVTNLLDNAIKYSQDGGEIVVGVSRDRGGTGQEWAVLTVSDTGLGIPAGDLPYVFERFHRGGNVGAIAGSGVGLSGTKQIVEQHGGTIAAESLEGSGSTFTVRLPLAD